MKINPELIYPNIECQTKEEVLKFVANQLVKSGYVTEKFVESILEREEVFPTGLPTLPFGVAIPHTDADKVMEPIIAFASLKNPVKFKAMGNSGADVEVKLIFMLALDNPEAQLQTLQQLTSIFQNEEMVKKLAEVNSSEEFTSVMHVHY
ncbi:EIICBA-Mtl [Oceanobacillus picturae]|uniref:EIICBA-Mtl n=1 Tax=Oceanobacillus picturae TaxID=171693 RepID=W9ACS3_9BACI|nr:PTS sugar transporter subunit IIA [Oceanobacillus picturae]CDO03524.1 EIICBA-Mtl [Oceanobacillus picturae]